MQNRKVKSCETCILNQKCQVQSDNEPNLFGCSDHQPATEIQHNIYSHPDKITEDKTHCPITEDKAHCPIAEDKAHSSCCSSIVQFSYITLPKDINGYIESDKEQ